MNFYTKNINKLKKQSPLQFGEHKKKINKKKLLITIITVVKNDEKKILSTLNSVFSQKYSNIEFIVIDGASSDRTLDIIKQNEKKIDLWISQKDKNMWDGINKGLKLASGDIVGILNSGDIFYKNALNLVAKYFKSRKIDYLFGSVKKDRILSGFEPEKINYRFNIYPAHSCGFFIKATVQKIIGNYNTNLMFGSDLDLFYRLIKNSNFIGASTNKNEVVGKFDLNGYSSRIPFYKSYYYEMKIRQLNGQNILFLIILYFAKILNKFKNLMIK